MRLERATRPVHPETRAALARRWAALPAAVRTSAQTIGRHAVGCEGTHGVFPRCNLTCTPCYHSADANKVRVDGAHTVARITAQMGLARAVRGPRAHAQLIGGEVTLLDPDDHAAALGVMRAHGREPMSFTHGDVDDAYLRALVLGPDGRRRLDRVSFAGHFDSTMRGRRGAVRPRTEAELHPFRRRFLAQLRTLRRAHGVRVFAAHNMTVTPANLDQVAEVVAEVSRMGYGLMSFQPAAHVGDERRWREDYRPVDIDAVWAELEAGMGQRLDHDAVLFGDPRCNRTALGLRLGRAWLPWADVARPAERVARDAFYAHFGGMSFGGTRPALLAGKILRVLLRHPGDVAVALGWAGSAARRVLRTPGWFRALRRREVASLTFEVHSFMDAADVAPAWAETVAGRTSTDPGVRATQERLAACTYSMAHPETGELVPACVQHSVLDPGENEALRRLLPLTPV